MLLLLSNTSIELACSTPSTMYNYNNLATAGQSCKRESATHNLKLHCQHNSTELGMWKQRNSCQLLLCCGRHPELDEELSYSKCFSARENGSCHMLMALLQLVLPLISTAPEAGLEDIQYGSRTGYDTLMFAWSHNCFTAYTSWTILLLSAIASTCCNTQRKS